MRLPSTLQPPNRYLLPMNEHLLSLFASLCGADGKADFHALLQATPATVIHGTEVHKDFTPIFGKYKTKAFIGVKPFNFTLFMARAINIFAGLGAWRTCGAWLFRCFVLLNGTLSKFRPRQQR